MAERSQLRSLTGLRFLAAIQVVVFHFAQDRFHGVLYNIVSAGYTGVSLFFVLSGFVLAYTYGRADHTGRVVVPRRPFLAARFARIYPMYVLSLAVALPMFLTQPVTNKAQAALLVLMLAHAWFPSTAAAWNGPAWSLSVEAFFYAVFPWALPAAARVTRRSFWTAMGLTFATAMLVPSLYAFFWQGDGPPSSPTTVSTFLNAVKFTPLLHLPEFVMGVLCGLRFLSGSRKPANTGGGVALAILGGSVIVGALAVSSQLPYPMMHNGLLAPGYCALIYGLGKADRAFAPLLGSRVMLVLGEASYGMYLLHVPLQHHLRVVWDAMGLRSAGAKYAVCYAVLIIFVPVVTFLFYERPARQFIRARLA